MDMATEMEKRVSEKQNRMHENRMNSICLVSSLSSDEIMIQHLPADKSSQWYNENCIGTNEIPKSTVKGNQGGTLFYTSNGKIMRSESSVQGSLKLTFKK